MTDAQSRQAEVYERRIRERMARVNVVLYITRDEWLESFESIYLELVEGTSTRYRPDVPIVCVLPRGADPNALKGGWLGSATVKWHWRAIIDAIREHAVPASAKELRLSRSQLAERSRITSALKANAGHLAATAAALGISKSTLRRKRVAYLIW